jgi:uncharacterized Zn-finger protein
MSRMPETKKRRRKEIEKSVESTDSEFIEESDWESVHKKFSRQKINNTGRWRYRCTLCLKDNKLHLCKREGDMMRHLLSLKHTPKSFFCTNHGCTKAYTRRDALKRHRKKCTPVAA